MAARSASLSIRVLVDAAQGAQQLSKIGDAAGGTTDKLAGMVKAAAAFAGVGAFMKGAVDAASRLQQSSGGVEAVFKGSADAVKQFGQNAAQSMGLSKSAYQELATVIGSQLKNAGTSMDQLAPKTDQIISKGADLAAMFGGTTAEAVGALSSALKGEMDPIERYGVTLNDAAVQAEIMALGLDTSTSAAKQAATQQARLSLIMKQTADSQGAAAKEADSYASVMQQLSAIWENSIAEVGSALLPALSKLGKALGDMAPAVASILGPLAEFAGWVLELPTPILAVAAGIALWKFSPISGMLSQLSSAMSNATSSAGGFKSAMAGIGKTMASGAILGGAMLLIGEITSTMAEAKSRAADFESAVQALGDELVRTGGKATAAFDELRKSQVENSDSFKALTGAGISYGDAMNFMTDQTKLSQSAIDAVNGAIGDMDPELAVATLAMVGAGDQAQKYAQQKMEFQAAEKAATGATQENSAATQEAVAAQQKAAEEQAKAALSAAQTAAANTELKTTLDGVSAAASSASSAVEYFTLQMNMAAGRTPTLDQAAKLLNDTMRETASAFQDSAEKGGINTAALTTWNAAALTSTAEGSALYDQLTKVQTAYATSTVAAYENAGGATNQAAAMAAASAAADTAYQAFITMATGAGLSATEAATLATNLGIVQGTQIDPKTFAVIAQNEQADKAVKDLQAAQIDPKAVTVTATVAPAEGAFDQLVQQELDNTVKVDADAKAAQGTVNDFTNAQRSTTPVTVKADPSNAQSTVNAFTQQQRSTAPVQVQANTSPAQSAITSLVTQQRALTISVDANTGPAQAAINAIQGKTVTIDVVANVSQASAAIAAVPRSVGATAATAGLMAAPTMRGLAAPTPAAYPPLRLGATTHAPASSVTYEINVSGGLDSADAIARRVADVLERRQRRISGITVKA
jgi:hypothetical protein